MDPALITAIVGGLTAVLTAIGTVAWKFIDRADKKRERREIKVEELLKSRVADLVLELKIERRYSSDLKAHAGLWREQLIANHIDPVPAEWPKKESHD